MHKRMSVPLDEDRPGLMDLRLSKPSRCAFLLVQSRFRLMPERDHGPGPGWAQKLSLDLGAVAPTGVRRSPRTPHLR
jgi:hypothetical protein